MTDHFYRLDVHRPITLLGTLLRHFAGNAQISLEGDLSQCDLQGIQGMAKYEPKNCGSGEGVILPVELSTLDDIIRQILPRAGVRNRIVYIGIEKDGKPVFNSYDGFSKGFVLLTTGVGEIFVKDLVVNRIISNYETIEVQSNS